MHYRQNHDEATSRRMKSIGRANTDIEMKVQDCLSKMRLSYRSEIADIAGRPDIILEDFRTVIFVNGCFWHGHGSCRKGRQRPKRNSDYWEHKILLNKERDRRVTEHLIADGWRVLTIWECEVADEEKLMDHIRSYIGLQEV